MKIILLTIFIGSLFGQSKHLPLKKEDNCPCTYPLKANTNWCQGSKGGYYCINRNGNKTYKPKIIK